MESAGTRGRMSLRVLLVLCLSIPAVSLSPTTERPTCQVDREFLTDDNICCDKCLPGYKHVKNCHGPGFRTNCALCPPGQYMDQMNYSPECFTCKRCKPHIFEIQVSACTNKQNTVCRCMDGYYKSSIDSVTYDCLPCSKCGVNETEVKKCSPVRDTECKCKDNYYRVKKKCLHCFNCTASSKCSANCTQRAHQAVPDTQPVLVNVICGAAAAFALALVLVVVVTHFVTKRLTKRKLLSSQEYRVSSETYEDFTTHFEEPLVHNLHSVPPHNVTSQEQSNLPDCIPMEIRIPDVIYLLLDLVPVLQMKQLVRSLGVSDNAIERAELDHHSSREAHYQMLRAWAEQDSNLCHGRGGQGRVLHLPLLYQLLDKLRLMHLEQTAQELETKYNCL